MKCVSTRGQAPAVCIDDALRAGLAADGGLYVPEAIPVLESGAWRANKAPARRRSGAHPHPGPPTHFPTLADTAGAVLAPYFTDSRLRETLPDLCADAFAFDAPLRPLHGTNDYLLELFHGPTAAFKDYAARFLAGALQHLQHPNAPDTTILVATSGDTGAAVAAAFHRRTGFRVVIVYPHGKVSPRQAHGLECWGDNVRALRVDGGFDDCQRMVKAALADDALRQRVPLSSANSISLGRLLPQAAYHAHAALMFFARHGTPLNLIVPTGNLGDAAAALLAKRMGLPIGAIALACNANATLPRYFAGGDYAPGSTIATLANAMDVGAPSNFERLQYWFDGDDATLRAAFSAQSVSDATIRSTIAAAPARHGIVPCPHTACGLHLMEALRAAGDTRPWAVAATAHPAKFESIVEPLVGHPIALPPALVDCLARPARGDVLPAEPAALYEYLLSL